LLAGTVLGLLRPVGRSALGAVLLGVVVGACVYGSVGFAMEGRVDLTAAGVLGTPVGALLGFLFWHRHGRDW
jgi:hypothetical protein